MQATVVKASSYKTEQRVTLEPYCFYVQYLFMFLSSMFFRFARKRDFPVGFFFRVLFPFHSIIFQLEFYVAFKSRCLQHENYLSILRDNMVARSFLGLQIFFFSEKTKSTKILPPFGVTPDKTLTYH